MLLGDSPTFGGVHLLTAQCQASNQEKQAASSLASHMAYFSILKLGATFSSEM
jgi:hypothetical protein